jgi:[Skp1-protein]-hydroxyproline N-acetylglucosaminyltransferase
MRFAKDWDVKLIEMLEKCESSKPIITSYPPAFSFDDDLLPEKPTLLVADKFSGDDGFLRIRSRFLNDLKFNSPIPSFFWAAGFSFSHSSLISQVSYFNRVENSTDSLDYLFFGEESFMSVRLWLSGWDFFAPNSSLIFHQWSRKYRPTFSELFKDNIHGTQRYLLKLGAMEFVSNFLENLHNFSSDPFTGYPYTRTISQYVEFSGVDYSNRTISSKSTNGGIDPLNFYSQNQILSLIQQNKFLLSYSAW